jgi:superfamily II DNA/RNA helicase
LRHRRTAIGAQAATCWASAQTGSGKTAAFALPLLQRLAAGAQQSPRRVRVLVLVPTRELAAQVGEVFRSLGAAPAAAA